MVCNNAENTEEKPNTRTETWSAKKWKHLETVILIIVWNAILKATCAEGEHVA